MTEQEPDGPEDLHRAANALLNTLWQHVYSGSRTFEENWLEMDRRFPQARWLHTALKKVAALHHAELCEPVEVKPSTDTMGEASRQIFQKRGWLPGDNLTANSVIGLMAEFGMQVYRGEVGCGYPDCGCCADAACKDAIDQHPDFSSDPSSPTPALGVDIEEVAMELRGIAEELSEGSGAWFSCSGCHNLNEGVPTGPWSDVLKCHLGFGCRECGGIGAVWDSTDYSAIKSSLPLASSPAAIYQIPDVIEALKDIRSDGDVLALLSKIDGGGNG